MKKLNLLLSMASIFFLGACQSQSSPLYDGGDDLILNEEGIVTKLIRKATNASGQEYYVYSYSISPSSVSDDVIGVLSWADSGVSEDVSNFISFSIDNDNDQFTITKLKDFSTQIKLTLYLKSLPHVTATVFIDLARKWKSDSTNIYISQFYSQANFISDDGICDSTESFNDGGAYAFNRNTLKDFIPQLLMSDIFTVDNISNVNVDVGKFNPDNNTNYFFHEYVTKTSKVYDYSQTVDKNYVISSNVLCYGLTEAQANFIKAENNRYYASYFSTTNYVTQSGFYNYGKEISLIKPLSFTAANFDENQEVYYPDPRCLTDRIFTGVKSSASGFAYLNKVGSNVSAFDTTTKYVGIPLHWSFTWGDKTFNVEFTIYSEFTANVSLTTSSSNVTF